MSLDPHPAAAIGWEEASEPSQEMDFSTIDAIVILSFALFGLMTYLGRWKGIDPFVFLSTDAGIVSSFVAAYDHPALFQGDALLGNFANYKYYLAFHPILIHFLQKAIDDYGTAYVSLLTFTVMLQALGFYVLGRIIFGSRYWAFLLSVINLFPVALPVREFWGVYDDPLPRSLFHAVLPCLMAAAYGWRNDYKKWPWLMLMAGLAFYAHPVSGLPWGFAIWMGMWGFLPGQWKVSRKLGYMFVLGLVFVVTLSPFGLNLAGTRQQAAAGAVQYQDVVAIIADRVGHELLDVGTALSMWQDKVSSWPMALFAVWSVVGAVAVSRMSLELRQGLRLIGLWVVGILVVSVGITFAEQTICSALRLPRFQMDSIRGIKYLVPIMFIFCLWPLAEFCRKAGTALPGKVAAMTLGAMLVIGWGYGHPPRGFLVTAEAWLHGNLMPVPTKTEKSAVEAVLAVREKTQPGDVILPLVLPLEMRYAAFRPLAYAYKDGGIFADTNYGALPGWAAVKNELEDIAEKEKDPNVRLKRLLTLSEKLGARYLLADFRIDRTMARSMGAEVVWSNDMMSLVRCRSEKAGKEQ